MNPIRWACIGKDLSDVSYLNGLKEGEVLSPLLWNLDTEYGIRKDKENQMVLELNGAHQPLVYADGVNIVWDNTNTAKTNQEPPMSVRKLA
jgi:hypothetical protein